MCEYIHACISLCKQYILICAHKNYMNTCNYTHVCTQEKVKIDNFHKQEIGKKRGGWVNGMQLFFLLPLLSRLYFWFLKIKPTLLLFKIKIFVPSFQITTILII